jgi:hypothetical protein
MMVKALKNPIFIVGSHRAGSTLWHNIISMCPGMMRLTDPRFLSERRHKSFNYFLKTEIGDLSLDGNIEKMVDLCLGEKRPASLDSTFWRFENIDAVRHPDLKIEITRRIKRSDRSLGAVARILLEEITRFSGYERACVKFPVDVGHVPELMTWFPNCKVMHIIRDPRALALSKSNDPSGTAKRVLEHPHLGWLIRRFMVWFVIADYRRNARAHERHRGLTNYRLFRYEDLLAEPENTLKDVCDFIEVEFTPDLLHPEKGRHQHQPSSLTGKQQKAFDRDAATRWQTAISPIDNFIITWLTRGSMSRLGYDPKSHPIFRKSVDSADSSAQESIAGSAVPGAPTT